MKCIELYKQGLWPEKPEGVTNEKNFHSLIRLWSRLEQSCGPEILKQKVHNKKRGPEDRYELVAKVLAGQSIKETAVSAGMHHSDQGWQYQHALFRRTLQEHGIIQSMSRKGNCYDNSIMETFFGRLKNEMYYGHEKEYTTFEEFAKAVEEYIDYYNNKRIQAKTKWMPPVKYREASMCCA